MSRIAPALEAIRRHLEAAIAASKRTQAAIAKNREVRHG